jgi:FMN phosphatase YigB (HAD superfamily)
VRAAKPGPEVFLRALELAGARPQEALHVGDSVATDIEGARAAGIRALLVARDGEVPPDVEAVRSLEEVASVL